LTALTRMDSQLVH